MIISSQEMLQAVNAIDLVPARSGIIPSEFIQLEKRKNKLYFSLASEVYGRTIAKASDTEDDSKWTFHVDRTSFVPFVKVAELFTTPHDYQLTFKDKKLHIKSGRRKVVFNAISFVQGYPDYEPGEDAVTIPLNDKQRDLLQLAAQYATADPTLSYINAVYVIENSVILASNRISLFYGENKSLPISVPLPLMLLKLIDNDLVRSVEVGKSVVKLVLKGGYICQAINAAAKKDFPVKATTKQFKRGADYPLQFILEAYSFLKAITRLDAYVKGIVAREMLVTLECLKGERKMNVYCDTPQGRFSEGVTLHAGASSNIKCTWLLPSLLPLSEAGKRLKTIEVRFDDKKESPYHLVSKGGIKLMLSRSKMV